MCGSWFPYHLVHGVGVPLSTGLPAVLRLILRLLWQGEEDRQRRVPAAPRLLPGWDGRLRLQLHHPIKKVIMKFIPVTRRSGTTRQILTAQTFIDVQRLGVQTGTASNTRKEKSNGLAVNT